ncbi:hypothetical protein NPIL_185941 [Nephila pilipes]|uniref:Uncharacterized protein n=1 Tax=Nephila pilipes TaxID=299642 RepID=A0A8X6THC4_NEPPI|nr:hypothetical protein NPIL_185941 [Nephila pilipes]
MDQGGISTNNKRLIGEYISKRLADACCAPHHTTTIPTRTLQTKNDTGRIHRPTKNTKRQLNLSSTSLPLHINKFAGVPFRIDKRQTHQKTPPHPNLLLKS